MPTAYPHLLLEGCASGGGRFDPAWLYCAPQSWTSDDTDAIERLDIQYGTSICYPVSSMGSHVSACPNHQTGRTLMNAGICIQRTLRDFSSCVFHFVALDQIRI